MLSYYYYYFYNYYYYYNYIKYNFDRLTICFSCINHFDSLYSDYIFSTLCFFLFLPIFPI